MSRLSVPSGGRATGLKVMIGYKVIKIPVELALALWLTLARASALLGLERLTGDIGEMGSLGFRVGAWMTAHLNLRFLKVGAAVAWLDVFVTTVEVVLLLRGKSWGEWLVAGGLGAMFVAEMMSLERRPSLTRVVVLILNGVVVAYLVARRLRTAKE